MPAEEKLKRQQLMERMPFDISDRQDVLLKTDCRCAHCGEVLYTGRNATIDHFVPLSKGGTNQKLNLIPLCEACNKRKTNRITEPDWYLKYLKKEYKEKLDDYFQSYIRSFEYVSRKNLLSCDMYEIRVYMGPPLKDKNSKKTDQLKKKLAKPYILERMMRNEREEMTAYFTQYLKKHDILDNEDDVKKNIEFWDTFGTIYCMRDSKTNEIRVMIPIMIGQSKKGEYVMQIPMFALYATDLSASLLAHIPDFFAGEIIREQHLSRLRVMARVPVMDNAGKFLHEEYHTFADGMWMYAGVIYGNAEGDGEETTEGEDEFYRKFRDIKHNLDAFFAREGYEGLRFMGTDIMEGYDEDEIVSIGKEQAG